jgi:hypothetical protein
MADEQIIGEALRAELGHRQWRGEVTEAILIAEVCEAIAAGASMDAAVGIVTTVAAAVIAEFDEN